MRVEGHSLGCVSLVRESLQWLQVVDSWRAHLRLAIRTETVKFSACHLETRFPVLVCLSDRWSGGCLRTLVFGVLLLLRCWTSSSKPSRSLLTDCERRMMMKVRIFIDSMIQRWLPRWAQQMECQSAVRKSRFELVVPWKSRCWCSQCIGRELKGSCLDRVASPRSAFLVWFVKASQSKWSCQNCGWFVRNESNSQSVSV